MKETYIILINVDDIDARKKCERIENTDLYFDYNTPTHEQIIDILDLDTEQTLVMPITDFMDAFNNEAISEVDNFLTYVNVIK